MKILYLSTIIGTIDSFLKPHIDMLVNAGHVVEVAGNFTTKISNDLKKATRNIYNLSLQRNPLSIKNLFALKNLLKLIKEQDYDLIHVHTPVASVIGRLACILTKTKCFYTAHGFHFYKGAPLLNWLVYFPIEWFLSFFTDTLITINTEDFEFAKRHLHAKRTEYIPGVGIDVDKYANAKTDVKYKRKELGIPEDCKLLLSVGELNKNKNHEVIIQALAKLSDKKIHYAICGAGDLECYLLELARKLGVSERLHLLGRRNDIPEILKCADIYAHPSFREGLPVSLMEAVASGLICIASNIRGCVDIIGKNHCYLLTDSNDADSWAKKINYCLISEVCYKKELFNNLNNFCLVNILGSTMKIYLRN